MHGLDINNEIFTQTHTEKKTNWIKDLESIMVYTKLRSLGTYEPTDVTSNYEIKIQVFIQNVIENLKWNNKWSRFFL